MSTAFFTDGRLALLAALQADATLAANVRTWVTWAPGLRRRAAARPADCPLLALAPAELAVEPVSNALRGVPQDVEIAIVTDGQDAAPCEELAGAAADVLLAAARDKLGLADDGLADVRILRIAWTTAGRDEPRPRWEARIGARLYWLRT